MGYHNCSHIGILFNRKSQTILFTVANGNITGRLNSSLLKEIPVIERFFFIIRQPFAGSPSFEEVEVCVPTILPGISMSFRVSGASSSGRIWVSFNSRIDRI